MERWPDLFTERMHQEIAASFVSIGSAAAKATPSIQALPGRGNRNGILHKKAVERRKKRKNGGHK